MTNTFIKFIILINILLLAGQFFMTSKRATDGAKLSQLDSEISALSQQNSDLKNQIYQFSSLSYISTHSHDLQLTPVAVSFFTPLSVASAVNLHDSISTSP